MSNASKSLKILPIVFAAIFFPERAFGQFSICNRSLDVVNVAVGQEVEGEEGEFQTEGWWTIGANQCSNVIREELVNRYIYVYVKQVVQRIRYGHEQ